MIENKNGLLQSEIDEFYRNTPDGCEVLETRMFNISTLKYFTVRLQYI